MLPTQQRLQWEAKRHELVRDCRAALAKATQTSVPEELHKFVGEQRALSVAAGRNRLDQLIGVLKEYTQWLKKTDTQFQDVESLAHTLIPVINALEQYEKLAKPEFTDPYPLDELSSALILAFFLGAATEPMAKDRVRMAAIRKKRRPITQDKNKRIAERAKPIWNRNRDMSTRWIASRIYKSVGLEHNTVEKKLAPLVKAWRSEQKSTLTHD